ncbi:MAG: tetratricopeptide repeat protein, partial [Salinibacterium sp.]|nr:tetratricopeptide repeat protein [Salinibacterium sp.]
AQQADLREHRSSDDADLLIGEANVLRMNFHRKRITDDLPEIRRVADRLALALGESHRETILARSFLALNLRVQQQFDEAESIWKHLLEVMPDDFDPVLRISIREYLVGVDYLRGQVQDATKGQALICADRDQLQGADHSDSLTSKGDLAFYLMQSGRLDEARVLTKEIDERLIAKLGREHYKRIMVAESLAKIEQDLGHFEPATKGFEEVLDIRINTQGVQHPATLVTMSNLAISRSLGGDYEGALQTHLKLLDIRRATLPEDSFDLINNLNNVASSLNMLGRSQEALPYHRECVERADRSLGRDHWMDATFRMMMCDALTLLGQFEEAERTLLEAHRVLETALGKDHANTAQARRMLSLMYEAWERPEDAARWAQPNQ